MILENMVYIIENNGVYGLTKGQYSATVEKGSKKKKGTMNEQAPIDLCAMAINLGCSFVARSFSGSKKQLTALLRAAMSHKGMAIIDVISPCVTFANNDESYKSYNYVKANDEVLHIVDYIAHFSPIEAVEVPAGEFKEIKLFDGSTLRLETVDNEHDPTDPVEALRAIHDADKDGRHVTGLLFYNPDKKTATETLELTKTPLMALPESELRPSIQSLIDLNNGFRTN
jgi:2-oxoglutarate ferredoxin oxidoreductase subunit beta